MNNPIEKPATPSPVQSPASSDPKHAQSAPGTPKGGRPQDETAPARPDAGPSKGSPNKQMQQAMPSGDALKGKWKQQVGAAKLMWGKLTDDELLQLEGQEQKLAGLVQERYAISRDEAARQARSFFEKHMS